MDKEILACIDEKNKKFLESGQISKYIFPMERTEAHNKNLSHLITRFFIVTKKSNDDVLYLIQKRAKSKKAFPEYFTDSSSGHVLWAKNMDLNKIRKDALRELEEEFGIPPQNVQKVLFYEINNEGNEIAYIFLGIVDSGVQLHPNPEELNLESSKFYNRIELEYLLENEKYIDRSKNIWKKLLNTDVFSLFENPIEQKNSNSNSTALFIGRFQPLHHGHIYVLKNIFKRNKKAKIGIGSSQLSHTPNDPFTKEERKEFLLSALKKRGISSKQYKIFYIPDIFNAKKWVDHVTSIVGEFDSVYSNSDWIRELFHNKGFKVGKKISIFKKKFNGNNIRRLIIRNDKNWKTLVPKEVVKLIEEYKGIERIKSLIQEKNE